ncbi:MAG: type II toxin-antitoxin system PemK/MazF family toxin [Jiangellaceae bacterium]
MRHGDIYLADLDSSRGSEAYRRRPVVVVSNNGANAAAERLRRGAVTIVPVTSNITRAFPFQTLLPAAETVLDRDSKAQAEQVRSIDSARLGNHVGRLTTELMLQLDEALRLHLSL